MARRRKYAALATGGIALAGALTACGNPITANRDFDTVSIYVTSQQLQNASGPARVVSEGVVLDKAGKQIRGTFFTETCAQETKTGNQQWRCLTYLAPGGSKLYVAGGLTSDPFGTQRALDRQNSTGSMTLTKVREVPIPSNGKNVPKGAKAYIVKVSLRKG